jgi:hypothetical protein
LLKEENELLMEAILFVVFDQVFKVIRKHNDLHGAHVSSPEFFCTDTNKADFLPDAGNICLFSSFKGSLVLL